MQNVPETAFTETTRVKCDGASDIRASGVLRLAATAVSSMAQDVIRHGRPRDPAPVEKLVDGIFADTATLDFAGASIAAWLQDIRGR